MARTAGLALALVLAATACGTKAAGGEIEKKIVAWAKGQRLALTAVRCPASIAVEVGATFTCTGATASGEQFTIAGRITSKAGANFEYALAVVEPTYVAETAAAMLTTALGQGPAGAPAAVTCGAPGRHRLPADHKLTCTVVAPDGAATTITLTFKADGDLDGWAVQ
jgi:hypothetical protein